jgi:glycosyltransferase involved in cell wall biosynthesis
MIALARFLRRQRVDIVHTHLFEPSVVGLFAGVLARRPIRMMTRHYSNYHTRIGKRWHVRADQVCNRLSKAIIAVSRHTADHIVNEEGSRREKVRVILNGIDFSRVSVSDPSAPARLRHELGAVGRPLLLVPGRLHPEKGQSFLFRALPVIRRSVPSAPIVLVAGAGSFEAAYRAEVRSVGCDDIVRFLGFRTDLPDLMAAADLVVLPSVAEAFGLVMAEALYLGIPVVATRTGGIPEIIEDGVDGVLVPPADADALANAIVQLLSNPEVLRRLAGAGHDSVRARFGFEKMIRAYEDLYENLLDSGRPR